jgi:alkanesulfonate monooxygenase SsuD/methylene tetrahydromethanopterin reductase-like flavin-dependent oxidoreductase (luciferase family)
MEFGLFGPCNYSAPEIPRGWPAAPRHFDANFGQSSLEDTYALFRLADEVGFDWVTVAEHHYHARQLSANPITMAAVVAQHVKRARIGVLGVTLPLHNPIRVAEDLALLDNMCNGRLFVGFFRGVPNEFMTYGTNPEESRERLYEGLDLIRKAWTEPEPFGWEGRYYRFRTVSIWPQPMQKPHPRMLVTGTTSETAMYAAQQDFDIGIAFQTGDLAVTQTKIYLDAALAAGHAATGSNVLFRHFAYVAETDEEALADCQKWNHGSLAGVLAPPPKKAAAFGAAMADVIGSGKFGGVANMQTASPLPYFLGSPETVAAQIREFGETTGIGRVEVVLSGDLVPSDAALRAVRLFGEEVIPRVRAATATAAASGTAAR